MENGGDRGVTAVENSTVDMMMKEGSVRERRPEEEKEDEARSRTTTTRMQSTHKTSRIGVTGV